MIYVIIDDYNKGISYVIPDISECPSDLSVEVREAVGRVFDENLYYLYNTTSDENNTKIVDNNGEDCIIFSIDETDVLKYLASRDQNNLITGV